MKNLNIKLSDEKKLKFYGLFKVATVGKYSESQKKSVGFFDFSEKYKK
jgi:acyl-CoA-binding protein